MSVQPGSPEEDELYCKPEHVAAFFDKFSGQNESSGVKLPDDHAMMEDGFSENTNPTETEVQMLIEEQTEWIEDYTGHAWRAKRVTNEMKDLSGTYYYRSGTPFQLMHREVRDFDPEKGDKLELYQGDSADGWENWLTSDQYEVGRNNGDYWIDNETGTLYLYKARWFWDQYKHLRITYRYGKEQTPATIRNICAKLVAADLLESQQFRVTTPGGEDAPDPSQVAQGYRERAEKRLERYKEVKSIGINS